MNTSKFEKTIDTVQASLVWFVIAIITVCIGILFLFDVLAGTGTMLFLTGGKAWQSVVISLATTGLLFALMFIGYLLYENKQHIIKRVGGFVLVVAFLIYIEDVIFDALLADILRYGTIAFGMVDPIQWMFRFLLGGISTVADALAIAMVLGLPVLKTIIGKAVQDPQISHSQGRPQYQNPRTVPVSIPRANHQKPTNQHRESTTYHPINYQNPLDDRPSKDTSE